jgi:hypothetical protein
MLTRKLFFSCQLVKPDFAIDHGIGDQVQRRSPNCKRLQGASQMRGRGLRAYIHMVCEQADNKADLCPVIAYSIFPGGQ